MRLPDLVAAFDEALEWALEDPLLADHHPSQLRSERPEAGHPLPPGSA